MAENKKSFVLYCDLLHTVIKLSDKDAGKLLKHILLYVNDRNPESREILINVDFEPIKQQLKRDLVKWEGIREKRSKAGKVSANKRQQKKQVSTHVKSVEQTSTNPTVSETVNVSVSDNVNDKDNKIPFDVFWDAYDKKVGKPKSIKKWNKLPLETQEKIMKHIPLYKSAQPYKQYRQNPETYFNNKTWNDELIGSQGNQAYYSDFDAIEYCKKYNIVVMTDKGRISGLSEAFSNIFEKVEDNKWRKK